MNGKNNMMGISPTQDCKYKIKEEIAALIGALPNKLYTGKIQDT